MINQKVKHTKFGIGEIIDLKSDKITILFEETKEEKTFKYPEAFEKFLEAKNNEFKEKIFEDICNRKMVIAKEEEQKRNDDEDEREKKRKEKLVLAKIKKEENKVKKEGLIKKEENKVKKEGLIKIKDLKN